MSDREAIEVFRRTGRHLGKFDSPESATRYAQQLHQDQESRYVKRADGGAADLRDGDAVSGPGDHTADIVPALLSNGEGVLNGEAMALGGDKIMQHLNREGMKLRKQGVPLSKIKPHFGIRSLGAHQ